MGQRRNRKLPHLSDYLNERSPTSANSNRDTISGGIGFVSAVGAMVPLWQHIGWWSIAAGLCIVLPVISGIVKSFWDWKWPLNDRQRRETEYEELHNQLKGYLDESRLDRHLDPICAALFEESSRHWIRISELFDGPDWNRSNLPSHYRMLRTESLAAADEAMEDLILMLQKGILKQPKRKDWMDVFNDCLEFLGSRRFDEGDVRYPAEYGPARTIAGKLAILAEEVESVAIQRATEATESAYSSPAAIDAILGELRAIKQAESELQEDLRA